MTCTHENFTSHVEVERTSDVRSGFIVAMAVKIDVRCATCLTPVMFLPDFQRAPAPDRPSMTANRQQVRIPVVPPPDAPFSGFKLDEEQRAQIREAGVLLR